MSKEVFPADAIPQKPLPEISEQQALMIFQRGVRMHVYETSAWEPGELDKDYFTKLINTKPNN
jgi:hypothetical protein